MELVRSVLHTRGACYQTQDDPTCASRDYLLLASTIFDTFLSQTTPLRPGLIASFLTVQRIPLGCLLEEWNAAMAKNAEEMKRAEALLYKGNGV